MVFPESAVEERDYIINIPSNMDVANICFQFAIIKADENRIIDDMGVSFTSHDRMPAEVGCTLCKIYLGKGYATEALRAMVVKGYHCLF